ncbi:MAG: hypothetical protein NVSMB64_21440 [Candidatus Velthaea sp.]
MIGRAQFLAGSAAAGAVHAFWHKRADAGWHHVHGANGLALSTSVPLDFTFDLVDAGRLTLAGQRGKVVVINLFATWCDPCRAEMPDLTAFARAHPADTLVIGVDVGEAAERTRAFRAASDAGFQLAADPQGALSAAVGMTAYPTTLIVRPGGRLACAFVGQITRDELEIERAHALTA